ncbi:MAG: hypothetical protein H7255_11635 [Ramlibacter sp.]|nr:hypothetical protein [Ramlibacter sp.]
MTATLRSVLVCLALSACASAPAAPASVSPVSLEGTWKVDLRPVPGAADYYKSLVVTDVKDKTFSGTFYGTPLRDGTLNTDWGAVRFAFVTEDLSGAYNHAGVLRDGKLEGTSHSLGRKRLSYWSAVRE